MNVPLARSQVIPSAIAPLQKAPFRPVQYLGSKLRVLKEIAEATTFLIGSSGRVGDLFAGTTVVGQALANHGFAITSVDTQKYSCVFANALLGISRKRNEQLDPTALIEFAHVASLEKECGPWQSFVEREDVALDAYDHESLRQLYAEMPLIWRNSIGSHYRLISDASGNVAFGQLPLVTTIYAGYYFGVKQALMLDRLRNAAEVLHKTGSLSTWQFSSVLTAIMHAASAASHSAGKHFAQPLGVGTSDNLSFLNKRLLEDRRVCILSRFIEACGEIEARSANEHCGHRAVLDTAEQFSDSKSQHCELYYLDPPYTAQQYSRFYHLLETIVDYRFPQLVHNGTITTGLYPTERFKSAFSSRKKAAPAFRHIIQKAKERKTSLLISYSQSARESQGNARMITLEELLQECRDAFGVKSVDSNRMVHRYRQFNTTNYANEQRDDAEMLITCKAH